VRESGASERLLRARADRALRAQSRYLEAVRATLTAQAGDRDLDALSALPISRLERIEAIVPRASESLRGARRLASWATAQIAATPGPLTAEPTAPAPRATPTAAVTATPTLTATPTPSATPAATPTPAPSIDDGAHEGTRRIHPRRTRLRERLELRVPLSGE
jgi:hypothetical protein